MFTDALAPKGVQKCVHGYERVYKLLFNGVKKGIHFPWFSDYGH